MYKHTSTFHVNRIFVPQLLEQSHTPSPSGSVICRIRLQHLTPLQRTILHRSGRRHRPTGVPPQPILTRHNGEVGQTDLTGTTHPRLRDAVVPRLGAVAGEVQLIVPAIVELAPLQLLVGADEPCAIFFARG